VAILGPRQAGKTTLAHQLVRTFKRRGFEIKRSTAPTVTPSMRAALADLKLSSLDGRETFPLAPNIRAVAAGRLLEAIEPL
jgi:molybdopterin-guanine dinucleotide biosynthesis protein